MGLADPGGDCAELGMNPRKQSHSRVFMRYGGVIPVK